MKIRLDLYLTENSLASSRTKAQNMIRDGLVFVDGIKAERASIMVDDCQKIEIKKHEEYVSRGAFKLIGALQNFGVSLKDKVVLDIGASTGGFTQVALKNGAKKVYALDIGSGQLDKSLENNPQVINLSNTDIRTLDRKRAQGAQFFTCDLSFISLTKILPIVFEKFGKLPGIFLFKPQFECGKDLARKYKGVIKDKKVHKQLLMQFVNFLSSNKIVLSAICPSPIKGGDGNIEYLLYLNGERVATLDIDSLVENAFSSLK